MPSRMKKPIQIPALGVLIPVIVAVIAVYAIGAYYSGGSSLSAHPDLMASVVESARAEGWRVVYAAEWGVEELDVATGRSFWLVRRGQGERRWLSPALSPDGRKLAYIEEGIADFALRLRDLDKPVAVPIDLAKAAAMGPPAFSADGAAIACAVREAAPGSAGALIVVETGKPARTISAGHVAVGPENAMPPAFSPDGKVIAYGAAGGGIEFVDRASGQVVGRMSGDDPIFLDDKTIGFEADDLCFRAAYPPQEPDKSGKIEREFVHSLSRARRSSPLCYSPRRDRALFVRHTGKSAVFPPDALDRETHALYLLDVPSARIVEIDPSFDGNGALCWIASRTAP